MSGHTETGHSLDRESSLSYVCLVDDPESLLSGPQIGIADIFMHTLSLGGESFWGFESYQMIQVFTQNPNKFGAFATRRLQDVDHVKTAGRWTVGS